MKKPILIVFLALVTSSCSLFRAKIPPYPTGIIFPLEIASEIDYQGEIINPMQTEESRVYLSTRSGHLYCFDGAERKMIWELKVSDNLIISPCLGRESVYVHDGKSTFFCVDKTGKIRWQKKIGGRIATNTVEHQKSVFFGTEEGRLVALTADQGEKLWEFEADKSIRSNLVATSGTIAFGCDDNHLYLLNRSGGLEGKFDIGGRTENTLAVDGNFLYFGTEAREIYCFDLIKKKRKWKRKTGGRVLIPPVFDEKRGLFSCLNNVLYCLNKKNGTILWWSVIPSRSVYALAIIGDRVVVTSLSSILMSFNTLNGETIGKFETEKEIRSNPLWIEPYLLMNLYDFKYNMGALMFARKKVAVTLNPSLMSPQKINTQIAFTAMPDGFHLPEYEFSFRRLIRIFINSYLFIFFEEKGTEGIIQEKSENNTWEWFPNDEGFFGIGVRVTDEKETAKTIYPFLILKEEPQVTLAFSKNSPQPVGEEIQFSLTFKGLTDPSFSFTLHRVFKLRFHAASFILLSRTKSVVQEKSDSQQWTWIPDKTGLYTVEVIAEDADEKVNTAAIFRIKKNSESEKKEQKIFDESKNLP